MPQPDFEAPLDDESHFDLERYLDEWYDKDDEFNQRGSDENDD